MTKLYIITAVSLTGDKVFYLYNPKTLGTKYSFTNDKFNIMGSVNVTIFTTLTEAEKHYNKIDPTTSYKDFVIESLV